MEVVEVKNGYGGGGGGTTVCVTGASGFIGSWLVMRLLQRGYYVRATVRDPDNTDKVKHLLDLPNATTHLSLWKADLDEDGSFDDAIQGCDGVFHVATPMNFVFVKDPENEYIKPTVDGVLNVMRSCCKAKTVKRIIYTSTMGTIEYQQKPSSQYDESIWTDVDFCRARKMFAWSQFGGPRCRLLLPTLTAGLLTSKLLLPKRMTTPAILSDRVQTFDYMNPEAEKAAWKFAEENGPDLITVHPCCVIGPFITPYKPPCTSMALALVTKNKAFYPMLTQGHAVHVDDVCNAHIYLFEHPQAKGRYICSSHSFTIFDLANSLSKKYPEYNIQTKFEGIDESLKPIPCPSKKLLDLGFKFKYNSDECDAGDLCAEAIEACKEKGQMPSL